MHIIYIFIQTLLFYILERVHRQNFGKLKLMTLTLFRERDVFRKFVKCNFVEKQFIKKTRKKTDLFNKQNLCTRSVCDVYGCTNKHAARNEMRFQRTSRDSNVLRNNVSKMSKANWFSLWQRSSRARNGIESLKTLFSPSPVSSLDPSSTPSKGESKFVIGLDKQRRRTVCVSHHNSSTSSPIPRPIRRFANQRRRHRSTAARTFGRLS